MQTIYSRPHFTRVALLERSGAVLYRNEDKIEVHFVVHGCPTVHRVWPCADDVFREALVAFQDRMFQPPDRLKMQQVDAVRLLSAWMFKNRDHIHVLYLDSGEIAVCSLSVSCGRYSKKCTPNEGILIFLGTSRVVACSIWLDLPKFALADFLSQ